MEHPAKSDSKVNYSIITYVYNCEKKKKRWQLVLTQEARFHIKEEVLRGDGVFRWLIIQRRQKYNSSPVEDWKLITQNFKKAFETHIMKGCQKGS